MKIVSVGGGPAGLYFSILMKKASPESVIEVYERNRHDDTFGWGVVFSDETLDNFGEADPESYAEIRRQFRYWNRIDNYYKDSCIRSTGHGFCGLSRKKLLLILQERCRELGVKLFFETEVESAEQFKDADLILAADGINSKLREQHEASFRPSIDWRQCKFAWFGCEKELDAFTFIFRETEHGVFQVHSYPFEPGRSTFIVECREEVWKRAGLDRMDEEQSRQWCEELFSDHLEGSRLLINRSLWRTFPTIKNERLFHENIVLLGDAAHTAHFSIGSGTKLAMEDAIALMDAFEQHGSSDIRQVLETYEDARRVDVIKIQKAAQTSLEWFENSARYMQQDPQTFMFNLMTRSKRITYDNLVLRDPELMTEVRKAFQTNNGQRLDHAGNGRVTPPPIFTPFILRGMQLRNRIVVSPMCQYSAEDGCVNDWHLVHLGSRAIGGAGLIITEMTDVEKDGRITTGCAGMYSEEHVQAWKRVVDFVHANSPAKIGIQLAHAGRKGSCRLPWEGEDVPLEQGGWQCVAPSALPFRTSMPQPKEMDVADMGRIRAAFVQSARWALLAGFDLIELHMAHGYLLSSFLSPLSNKRSDEFGGSLEKRMRFPLEVFDAIREVWPQDKPMSVRISASDWVPEGGFTPGDAVAVSRMLQEHHCDIIDVSTGGNAIESKPVYGRMYQVPFAEKIRSELGIPVMAVGAILGADHANTILAAGRADLCAMARPHLRDAYLTLHAAEGYGYTEQFWPDQYLAAKPAPPNQPKLAPSRKVN